MVRNMSIFMAIGIIIHLVIALNVHGDEITNDDESLLNLCGPRVLLLTCQMFGIKASLPELVSLSKTTKQGTSMEGLYQTARAKGLAVVGKKLNLEDLKKELSHKKRKLAIAYVNDNHFMLIDRLWDVNVRVIDYDKGAYIISQEEFFKMWDSYILIVSKPKGSEKKNAPNIEVEEYDYNFGKASQYGEVSHTFLFQNTGRAPLVITSIQKFCGCTISEIPEAGYEVAPGQRGKIPIRLELGDSSGNYSRSILIQTNDPAEPFAYLTLSGYVEAIMEYTPKRIYLGQITFNEPIKRKVKLFAPMFDMLEGISATTTSDKITAQIFPIIRSEKEPPEKRYMRVIGITLDGGLPPGMIKEKIILNTKKGDEIQIPIDGELVGDIKIFPQSVFFGIVGYGNESSREVKILNEGNTTFKVMKAVGKTKFIRIKVVPQASNKEYVIRMTLNSDTPVGSFEDEISIYTNDPRQQIITIPIYGLVREGK